MKSAFFAVALLLLFGTARADDEIQTADEFLRKYDAAGASVRDGASVRELLQLLAQGEADGMEWLNFFLTEVRKEEPIFCVPNKLRLTGEQIVDVVRRQVEHHPALGSQSLGFAVQAGLVDTFPCPPK